MTDRSPSNPLQPNSPESNPPESNKQSIGSRETIAPSGFDLNPKNSGPFPSLPVMFGRFEVRKHLGKGAMGTVYLAFDPELNKPEIHNEVAIKIPLLQTSDDSTLLERFCREAQATGAMNHPNICKLYEVGEINGTHYISMEYIDGRPLADYIGQDQQPQLPRQVAGIIRKLAEGLAHAHERGFIHRDLKPTNVMIATNGQPKIMDFGLARRFGVTGDIRLTQSNTIVGSPAYMSPEQARSENDTLTPASDIYSLGTLFFELLTCELPFKGPMAVVLGMVALNRVPKPSSIRADVDPRLEALCLKMLEKKVESRPKSMTEVANALTEWLRPAASKSNPVMALAEEPVALTPKKTAAPRADKTDGIENQKRRVTDLLDKHEYGAAISHLEKMINLKDARFAPLVAWAKPKLKEVRATEQQRRESSAPSCATAEQLLKHYDYAGAVALLTAVPSAYRSLELRDLLSKATELHDECEHLQRSIEDAIRDGDKDILPGLVKGLLKLKPNNKAIKQLAAEVKELGAAKVIARRKGQRQTFDPAGRVVEPQHIALSIVLVVGLFVGVSLMVRNYLATTQPPTPGSSPDPVQPTVAQLPRAVTQLPDWLKQDAPFDVQQFWITVPAHENAAPLYLDALYEFSPHMEVCFPADIRAQRTPSAKTRYDRSNKFQQDRLNAPQSKGNPAERDAVLQEHVAAFQKLAEAQQRPRCLFEIGGDLPSQVPVIESARVAARIARMQVERDIERGDFDGVVRMTGLMLRLSRDLRSRTPTLWQDVATSLESVVISDFVTPALKSPALKTTQCDELMRLIVQHTAAVRSVDPLLTGVRADYVRQRMLLHDLQHKTGEFSDARFRQAFGFPHESRGAVLFTAVNGNTELMAHFGDEPPPKAFQTRIETLLAATKPADFAAAVTSLTERYQSLTNSLAQPFATRRTAEEALNQKLQKEFASQFADVFPLPNTLPEQVAAQAAAALEQKQATGKWHGPYLAVVLLTSKFEFDMGHSGGLVVSDACQRTNLEGAKTLVALRRWRVTHSNPPSDFATMCREAGLSDLPRDYFSDGPLLITTFTAETPIQSRSQRTPKAVAGETVIYSIGSDGKDDRALRDFEFGTDTGDFLFRLEISQSVFEKGTGPIAPVNGSAPVVLPATPPTAKSTVQPIGPRLAPEKPWGTFAKDQPSPELLLVGFDTTVGTVKIGMGDFTVITSLKPLYSNREGKLVEGTKVYGKALGEKKRLLEMPRAIGAVNVRGTVYVDSIEVKLMPTNGDRLSTNDVKTEKSGGTGGGIQPTLGGDGKQYVGCVVYYNNLGGITGLGLIPK